VRDSAETRGKYEDEAEKNGLLQSFVILSESLADARAPPSLIDRSMSLYAIGDIQGCHAELCELLALIGFSARDDQLWLVGDLVNRGPGSLAVLRDV